MSCSLSHCFGKSKQKLGVFDLNDKLKEILHKGKKNLEIKKHKRRKSKSPKRRRRRSRSFGFCNCGCKGCQMKENLKMHSSKRSKRRKRRSFGYQVLRSDQIIRLVNGNKVYSNKTCD